MLLLVKCYDKKWLSFQGVSLKKHLHAGNQQKKVDIHINMVWVTKILYKCGLMCTQFISMITCYTVKPLCHKMINVVWTRKCGLLWVNIKTIFMISVLPISFYLFEFFKISLSFIFPFYLLFFLSFLLSFFLLFFLSFFLSFFLTF